jgi:glycosyltransferase involved in cell wall biosynthesis
MVSRLGGPFGDGEHGDHHASGCTLVTMALKGRGQGLVLVIPKAGSDLAEHFAHTFRLAGHVARQTRTAVIVERLDGAQPVIDPSVEVYVQRHVDAGFVPRALELARLAVQLRRKGFRSFFVRTSQTAAVPLILTRKVLGGRVMYWHCGKLEKNRLRDLGIRATLRGELPMRAAFRWADAVVTGTDSLAAHYSCTYGIPQRRMSVLPNEIDLDWFTPASTSERRKSRSEIGIAPNEALVLSVHRLSPVRRTLLYLPALLELVRRHEHVHFVLAGGGPEEADVRRAVGLAQLGARVHVLGSVPHQRIRRLYAAADAFVMPSYTEGFPRVLLEAMAMALPIAATDVGGVREILPSVYHERLANRERPFELARALAELILDPATAAELAAEARMWVQRFDAETVAGQLVELARQ